MIDYAFGDTLPEPATALEVAPGVRWIRMPLPYALNHINLWLVDNDDGNWCAIDTGLAMGDVQTHWQTLLQNYPLTHLIVTHYHPDHLGLAAWLQEQTGIPMAMTLGEYLTAQAYVNEIGNYSVAAMLAFYRRHGLSEERLAAMAARGNGYKRAVPQIPASYTRLQEGDLISIGAHDWRVIIGYGHAAEHAALYCEALGVLIAGDMLLPSISTNVSVIAANPEEDALTQFLDSIRRFCELPDDTLVLPSHGRPFRGIKARVVALESHHAERCKALVEACLAAPQTAASLLPVLFQRDITDPHQTLFAMSEAIAHLNYLELQGAVWCSEEQGVLLYSSM